MDDSTGLLRLELETLWVTDGRGRLERARAPEVRPVPLLVVAAGSEGAVWACSAALRDDLVAEIDGLLAAEHPSARAADIGWRPANGEALVQRLAARPGPVGNVIGGPSYVLPRDAAIPKADPPIECLSSTEVDEGSLAGLMPDRDRRSLQAPWAVAMVDGSVASVCETARSAPAAVEAGVWTYRDHRRRGLASASAAAWLPLVADRAVFYSTSSDNVASRALARRLGFQPLGQWWSVYATVGG